jgi:hypothetical protein
MIRLIANRLVGLKKNYIYDSRIGHKPKNTTGFPGNEKGLLDRRILAEGKIVRMIDKKSLFRNDKCFYLDVDEQGYFNGILGRPMKTEPHGQILDLFPPPDCKHVFIH